MKRTTTWILYIAYALLLTGVFLYLLFPAEAVKSYITYQVSRARTDVSVVIGGVKPAFPPGLTFREAQVAQGADPLVRLTAVKVMPELTTLLRPRVAVDFDGDLYGGELSGQAVILKPGSSAEASREGISDLTAALSGVRIGDISILRQRIPDYRLSGLLNAGVDYHRKPDGESGEMTVTVADLTVELVTPLFNLAKLTFQSVTARAVLGPNREIRIEECVLKGPQINGTLSGTIALRNPPPKSILNLSGSIVPHSSFLASLGSGFPASLLLRRQSDKGEIPFRIGGTIDNPAFSML